MSAWLSVIPAGALALLLVFVPGLLLGRILRLRGFLWWGSAPLLSGGVLGATAIAAPMVGLEWGLGSVAAGTALGLLIAFVVRLVTRAAGATASVPTGRIDRAWPVLVALGVAVVLLAGRIVAALDGPHAISQTFDANYHLNAVQFILDQGSASSLHMTMSNPTVGLSFYPALWHGIVALVHGFTAVGVPEATVVLTIVVSAVVWPLSVVGFARVLFGPRALLLAASALLATSFFQFPELLVYYGVLYPNLIAYAMLPAFSAIALSALRQVTVRGLLAHVALLAVGALSLTLGQTNALFAAAFMLLPTALYILWNRSREWLGRTWRPRASAIGLLVVGWAVGLAAVLLAYRFADRVPQVRGLRTSPVYWPADDSALGAMWNALTLAAEQESANWAVAALVVIGLVSAARIPSLRWLVGSHAVIVVLYVVAASIDSPLRSELTGYWYGDDHRLAALLPVTGVPLAALGARWVARTVLSLVDRRRTSSPAPRHGSGTVGASTLPLTGEGMPPRKEWAVVAVLAVLVVAHTTLTPGARESFDAMARGYNIAPTATGSIGLLAGNEYELLGELPEIVPEGVVVAGNPWDGSAMSWAVGEREALFPHISIIWSHDAGIIAMRLNEAHTDPEVCQAVANLNLGYVLDMRYPLWGGDPAGGDYVYPGLDRLEINGVAVPVAAEGPARLLKITACG